MLCPEINNFPPPKVMTSCKRLVNLETVTSKVKLNYFYKSLIITCPDYLNIPGHITDTIIEDKEYYKITDCSLTEFLDNNFINSFIKGGDLYCLSVDRNCIVDNCAAITPDGVLTLHVLDFIYQTLGLEGTKQPYNYYEVKINLKNLKRIDKVKQSLKKLGTFNFHVLWEPDQEDVCPSSIAKYFYDRNVQVELCTPQMKALLPKITEIPTMKDVDPEDMVEWIGMLAHEADLSPTESYISTYGQPESECNLNSTKISVLIVKGFFTPSTVIAVCRNISELVATSETENLWMSVSVQSYENSLFRWDLSTPMRFQAHNSSCNIFFMASGHTMYTIGQLKYS